MKPTILDHDRICRTIQRMAWQIYESNADCDRIVLAGIRENGYVLAKKLKRQLRQICPAEVVLCAVEIDKRKPLRPVKTSIPASDYENASVVLVDDVLNSGSTMAYGIRHFLGVKLKQLKTAVLVDRSHKKYPVKVDFTGLSLSTSLRENVAVVFEKDNDHAVLE